MNKKSVVVVVLLAVAAYFLFRPTTFSVKNDIFMYKLPEDVYEFMSDMKRTIEKHSMIGGKCSLLKQRTRKDGVKEKLFLVEKIIPLFWDYELPLNLEIKLTLAIPNKELLYNFVFVRGYVLKLHGRMTFERRDGHAMAGTFLTEELTVTCPWLAQTFVENNLRDSHKDTLISMRNGLESMYVSRDTTKVAEDEREGREEGHKKTLKKRKGTASANKEETETKKDGMKKSSAASGQKKVSKERGQDKKKALKNEEQQTKDEKTEKKASQSVNMEPRRTTDEKAKRKTSQDTEKTLRRQEKDGEVKKTEERKKERKAEVSGKKKERKAEVSGKKKERKGKDDQVKDAGKRRDEAGKEKKKKKEMREEVKEVKREKNVEKEEQGKKESKLGKDIRMEGLKEARKPGKAKEPETGSQKPRGTPKAEKVTKPVKAALNQNAKTKGQGL